MFGQMDKRRLEINVSPGIRAARVVDDNGCHFFFQLTTVLTQDTVPCRSELSRRGVVGL